MSIPWWLIASYGYYIKDRPIMKDNVFDFLSHIIERDWRLIKHRHKWLIDHKRPNTGHYLTENDYPQIVIGAYYQLIMEKDCDKRFRRRHRRVP